MKRFHIYRSPEDDAGGGAAVADPPAPAAAPAAAPEPTPAAAPVAPAPAAAAPVAASPAPEPAKGYWPEDWRKTVSKDDAKVLSRLERYASPEAAMQALIEAQNRIAKGELKPVLGKNATPEQLKEYREAVGIPESPDKYDLGKDFKTDHIDAQLLAPVLKKAHETNQTPAQVKGTIEAWNEITRTVQAQRAEEDQKAQTASEDALRAEWGSEFRRNINLVHGLLDGAASPNLKDNLLGGRLADGTPIGSSPEALKMLVGLALIQNPAGTVVPGGEGNQMQSLEDEIGKIEKMMRTDRQAYNRDDKIQSRYRDLINARESLKARNR